jgi:hypothetical protein
MNAPTLHLQPIGTIAAALQTAVKAAQMIAPFNGPAFGNVALFDSENLVAAFQYLLIVEQRVCVIVPLEERWENISKQGRLITKRVLPVMLLVSDRDIASRQVALYGDNTTPGAFALRDLVLAAVTGQLISNPSGVICEPASCCVMSVKDTEQKLPNRITVGLEVNCRGGWIESQLDPGPTI